MAVITVVDVLPSMAKSHLSISIDRKVMVLCLPAYGGGECYCLGWPGELSFFAETQVLEPKPKAAPQLSSAGMTYLLFRRCR